MSAKPIRRETVAPARSHLLVPLLAGAVLVAYLAGIYFLPRELPAWRSGRWGWDLPS